MVRSVLKSLWNGTIALALAISIPSSSHGGPGRDLYYNVLLSHDHQLADLKWSRMTSGTTFQSTRSIRVQEIWDKSPAEAVALQGPRGVAIVRIQHDKYAGFCFGPLDVWTKMAHWRPFDSSDEAKLRDHVAVLSVQFHSSSTSPADRALACAELLTVLSKATDAIGIMNMQAVHYTALRLVNQFIASNDARSNLWIFKLLMNVHVREFDGETWIHTHGMDQVALPDIELWIKGRARSSDVERVLMAAHDEMIGCGVLQVGQKVSLPKNGAAYRVTEARPETDCGTTDNELGAIQLVVDYHKK